MSPTVTLQLSLVSVRLFFFFIWTLPSVSAYEVFDSCAPRNCGGLSISYPFFIVDDGRNFCGYPGFDIRCLEDKPVYRTSTAHYLIEDIFYDENSFRLVDVQVLNNSNCPMPQLNYSFDRSSINFSPYHADICFFYNCNDSFSVDSTLPLVSCGSEALNRSFVALDLKDDGCLDWTRNSCESVVAAPVQLDLEQWQTNVTIEDVKYIELLRRGFMLTWTGYDCKSCRNSGGRCGFKNGISLCYCSDGPQTKNCEDGNRGLRHKMRLGVGIGGSVIALCLFIYMIYLRRKYAFLKFHEKSITPCPSPGPDMEESGVYFEVPIFTTSELEEATHHFASSHELGDGGFGTVYYGKLQDGREVAVKRLYKHSHHRVKQFMNEVEILTRLRHKNLVSLYGCTSRDSRELLLVYEYISNGTVADHIHSRQANSPATLPWRIRMNISIETATALTYLHACAIVHRDVKTNNILLDKNFGVKVADFGLSRPFPNDVSHISTAPQGTPGYVDPEYYQCYQLTEKSDVYSFGVVLIELISSMSAVDISREKHEINLANFAMNKIQTCAFGELIDRTLGFESDSEIHRMTTSVAELAFRCLQQDKEMRPSMYEVLEELKTIANYENAANKTIDANDGEDVLAPSPMVNDDVQQSKNLQLIHSPVSVTQQLGSSGGNYSAAAADV